jgi:hypothetical protein
MKDLSSGCFTFGQVADGLKDSKHKETPMMIHEKPT